MTTMASILSHALPRADQAPGVLRPIPVSDHGSRCGLAAATSLVELMWAELDGGTRLHRDVAQDYARKIVEAYLTQVERVARTEA